MSLKGRRLRNNRLGWKFYAEDPRNPERQHEIRKNGEKVFYELYDGDMVYVRGMNTIDGNNVASQEENDKGVKSGAKGPNLNPDPNPILKVRMFRVKLESQNARDFRSCNRLLKRLSYITPDLQIIFISWEWLNILHKSTQ